MNFNVHGWSIATALGKPFHNLDKSLVPVFEAIGIKINEAVLVSKSLNDDTFIEERLDTLYLARFSAWIMLMTHIIPDKPG